MYEDELVLPITILQHAADELEILFWYLRDMQVDGYLLDGVRINCLGGPRFREISLVFGALRLFNDTPLLHYNSTIHKNQMPNLSSSPEVHCSADKARRLIKITRLGRRGSGWPTRRVKESEKARTARRQCVTRIDGGGGGGRGGKERQGCPDDLGRGVAVAARQVRSCGLSHMPTFAHRVEESRGDRCQHRPRHRAINKEACDNREKIEWRTNPSDDACRKAASAPAPRQVRSCGLSHIPMVSSVVR
ncbi:hypothetical protein KM043_017014 [Ampulex compressa]|nr:hypothetical protein KM043_017014 [Ampulex compressa]